MNKDIENLMFLEGITNVLEEHHEIIAEYDKELAGFEAKLRRQRWINILLIILLVIAVLLGVLK